MSAIDPQRLIKQVAQLSGHASDPAEFSRNLHDILVFYHNHTLRQSPFFTPRTLLKTYNVPAQVTRQIELGILPQILADPDQALTIADHLWQDEYINVRELACFILGSLPISHIKTVKEHILEWVKPGLDSAAVDAVLTKATLRLWDEAPLLWEEMVLHFLSHPDSKYQSLGLRAITNVIRDPKYPRIPALFKLLRPFLIDPVDALQSNLDEVIKALAHRTPLEAIYFIKEIMANVNDSQIEVTVRRYASFFPEEHQVNLLEAVKAHARSRPRPF